MAPGQVDIAFSKEIAKRILAVLIDMQLLDGAARRDDRVVDIVATLVMLGVFRAQCLRCEYAPNLKATANPAGDEEANTPADPPAAFQQSAPRKGSRA